MNNTEFKIQEDAKSDWMKIVKRHKKKQNSFFQISYLLSSFTGGNQQINQQLGRLNLLFKSTSVD